VTLNKDVRSLSEFEEKNGLSLLLNPFRSTEKEIHRWVPIPFLKIPRRYKLGGDLSDEAIKQSVDKTVTDLANDLKQFDIIRSEWNDEYEPVELNVDGMD